MSFEPTEVRLVTYKGDTDRHTFEIRRFGQKALEDVSAASAFTLTWENEAGVSKPSIALDSGALGADWSGGLVVLEWSSANLSENIEVISFALRMTLSGGTKTLVTGHVDVRETPGI